MTLHFLRHFVIPAVFVLLTAPSSLFAQKPTGEAKTTAAAEKKSGETTPKTSSVSITKHSAKIQGKTLDYTATAGTMPLKADDGKVKASMFFVAYTKTGETDPSKRPVTFCFNGGPGSSSIWLHLGMLGPKRVPLNDDASTTRPPFKLINNDYSLLDRTDLVFIDPISTGFSRAAKGESAKQFHGYEEDLQSVGQFIHEYVTQNRRWSSPKLLLGESYGTLRAAGLSGYLQDRYKMSLNGIVMVSSVIDFKTIRFSSSNDLPNVLFLPSYTATAWHHKKLPSDLQQQDLAKTLKEVEKFATEEYTVALMKGAALPEKERDVIAAKIARYTGVSAEYVLQNNLRMNISRFTKELLRDQRRTVGRFDSRYQGIDRDAAGDSFDYDPSYSAVDGPFGATMNDYVRTELKYETSETYEVLTGKVHPWSYKKFTNRYVSASETLRQAMTKNPHLKVFVANGYYDLATPYFASQYSYNHLSLDPTLQKNVTMGYYHAGHMMYVHEPSLKQLRKDLERFYEAALK